ncbi:MAG: hypothetical protein K2X60_05555, partial [Xanthobacteraceae bacterium]|nr:hypothetical protein [Xanthobacteraceae bacterium]
PQEGRRTRALKSGTLSSPVAIEAAHWTVRIMTIFQCVMAQSQQEKPYPCRELDRTSRMPGREKQNRNSKGPQSAVTPRLQFGIARTWMA